VQRSARTPPAGRYGPPAHVPGHLGPEGEVAVQDGRTHRGIDFFQAHPLAPAVPQHRPAAGRADVAHPVRVLAEHRHHVAVTLIVRDDQGKRMVRPERRPGTPRVTQLLGASTPLAKWMAEILFISRARRFGRALRYSQRSNRPRRLDSVTWLRVLTMLTMTHAASTNDGRRSPDCGPTIRPGRRGVADVPSPRADPWVVSDQAWWRR
jgi:hypothetical protein